MDPMTLKSIISLLDNGLLSKLPIGSTSFENGSADPVVRCKRRTAYRFGNAHLYYSKQMFWAQVLFLCPDG